MADISDRKKERANRSVTDGSMLPSFIMFMLPLMAASCLMQSYAIADGLILGNAISQDALGSVSTCSSILDVCNLIQIGLAGGCSIMVSHLFGAEKYGEVNRLISEIRRLILVISAAIAVFAIFFAPQIMKFIHTPDNLYGGAVTYLRINFLAVPFTALYSLQAGVLRGMGDSKRPLGGIAVSSAVNICLDLLFVVVLKYGIAGAAIATLSSEALSAGYLWLKLEEKRRRLGTEDSTSPANTERENHIRECISLSVPQIIQSAVYSVGGVLLQNITNILGAGVVIGVSVAFKIDSLLLIPLLSISTAVSVFTGQNIGAGKFDRVKSALNYGIVFSLLISVVMSLILWKFGLGLFSLFGLDEATSAWGFRYIAICLPFYWIFGMQFVLGGYLNGAKHTRITSAASIAGLAGRLLLAYLGWRAIGPDVLPAAEALAWIIGAGIDLAAVLIFRRKTETDIIGQ